MTIIEWVYLAVAVLVVLICIRYADRWSQHGQFVVAVAAVFVVAAYTYFARQQAIETVAAVNAATEQAKLIRENNIVSQRAFVSIPITSSYVGQQSGKPTGFNIFIAFANGGNTGTQDLHIALKCAPSVDHLREPWPLLHKGRNQLSVCASLLAPMVPNRPGAVFPGIKSS